MRTMIVALLASTICQSAKSQESKWEAFPNERASDPIIGFASMEPTDQEAELGDMIELSFLCSAKERINVTPQGHYPLGSIRGMWILSHNDEVTMNGMTHQIIQDWRLPLQIRTGIVTSRYLSIWFFASFGLRSVTFDVGDLSELDMKCREDEKRFQKSTRSSDAVRRAGFR